MNAPLRRGACPGLSAPMQTGDGLLVRLRPIGTVSLCAFAELCAAARTFGNGIVEVTGRGSIQIRGLSEASAPCFSAAAAALGIAAEEGVAVHVNPLAGLDPHEVLDAGKFAADLRAALARRLPAARLAPKISVVIDGGGALTLDALSADVRLRAEQKNGVAAFRLSVGGNHAHATQLGLVARADAVEGALRLLEVIARRGPDARARDAVASLGSGHFLSALDGLLLTSARARDPPPLARRATAGLQSAGAPSAEAESGDPELDSRLRRNDRQTEIGVHPLGDGTFAFGVGLAFGHAEASALERLAEAAAKAGASGMRAAPGRTLLAIGFAQEALPLFVAQAEQLGFIVRPDDPRRYVFACAGAPVCASAHIAARAMAPRIAADCARSLGELLTIHISGCAKGCAHPAPAALTIVGRGDGCALIAKGTPRDRPFAIAAPDELPAAIAEAVREESHV
jgi:precorrin-3B synthase